MDICCPVSSILVWNILYEAIRRYQLVVFYQLDTMMVLVENKQKIIIIAVVVALVVAAGGFWYWSKSKQAQEEGSSLGSEIFDRTQSPLEGQVPDANPFKDQKNPLDSLYKNPFE